MASLRKAQLLLLMNYPIAAVVGEQILLYELGVTIIEIGGGVSFARFVYVHLIGPVRLLIINSVALVAEHQRSFAVLIFVGILFRTLRAAAPLLAN